MNKLYIIIVGLAFAAFAIVFNTFPRPTFSELEKRELATFPQFSFGQLTNGSFTSAVSSWFSDSEPYRDHFMHLSMMVKDIQHIATSDDNITFHASTDKGAGSEADGADGTYETYEAQEGQDSIDDYTPADENAKIANNGILIIGQGQNVRALMAFGGSGKGCVGYAMAANKYKETFPDVNVYCMVIPTSAEFYCPEKARKRTNPQRPTIDNVIAHLSPDVKMVDVYYTLQEHAAEDIYLRTDHHWAPLGAFYAAKKFAEVAGVPFRDLDGYEQHVVHGYVGSMYGYSQDIAVKNAPEDFVYYVPTEVTYETTYTNYSIDSQYRVTGEGRPFKSRFFFHYKDGSGGAYCTFMGGDTKLTKVVTSTKNGRRVIILKDSFGNAIPGYLFYSFEEVHVIDSRYFTKNMVDYVAENGITDILFANNIFKAYSSYTYKNYTRFLTQRNGTYHHRPDSTAIARDTATVPGASPSNTATVPDGSPSGSDSPSGGASPSGTTTVPDGSPSGSDSPTGTATIPDGSPSGTASPSGTTPADSTSL